MPTHELDDAISLTQQTFKPIFAKPKCTSKLLAKPPFRFIHDIIAATKKSTGFPNRYFSAEELNSSNLTDKAAKVSFLEKLIYLVEVCHGSPIDVRPSKIIAGLDPMNTNVLLATFGKIAVDVTIDHDAAIAYCKTGGKVGQLPQTMTLSEAKQDSADQGKDTVRGNDAVKNVDSSIKETKQSIPTPSGVVNGNSPAEAKENASVEAFASDLGTGIERDEIELDLEAQIEECNSDIMDTITVIRRVISKPQCTEKLLGKPPFRFIHDVIMAVNKVTDMGLESIFRYVR